MMILPQHRKLPPTFPAARLSSRRSSLEMVRRTISLASGQPLLAHFAAPIRLWRPESPAASSWDAKATTVTSTRRFRAQTWARPGPAGTDVMWRVKPGAQWSEPDQRPGMWCCSLALQCSTAWEKPSGKTKSAKIRPARSPISRPVTNLPMSFSCRAKPPPGHCSTNGPPQTGEIMEGDCRERKNLPIRGAVAIAARRFAAYGGGRRPG
jgi:hypothetical protein